MNYQDNHPIKNLIKEEAFINLFKTIDKYKDQNPKGYRYAILYAAGLKKSEIAQFLKVRNDTIDETMDIFCNKVRKSYLAQGYTLTDIVG